MQLAQWTDRFAAVGVTVAGMTYDDRAVLKAFHAEQSLNYPLLQDEDARHVEAYGVRNKDYSPGDQGFGIPHPGILYITHDGVVALKFAIPGFRERPPLEDVYQAIVSLNSE